MANQTAEVRVSVIVSDSSDLSDPIRHDSTYAATPEQTVVRQKYVADSTGDIYQTSVLWATIDVLVIESLEASGGDNLTAQLDTAGNANTDVIIKPQQTLVLTDVDPDGEITLTPASGDIECIITILGTSNA